MSKKFPYAIVLTHDVELVSLRELPWHSRTLWGFVFRGIVQNYARLLRREISVIQYLSGFLSGLLMPLMKLGLMADPVRQSFKRMLDIERKHSVRSSLYFIPVPGHAGKKPNGAKAPADRAAHYRIQSMGEILRRLERGGWEIGVHGIDSYRQPEAARRELKAMSELLGHNPAGHRSHWLYTIGDRSWEILRQAGFSYDTSYGSNDEIGWPGGKSAPFEAFPSHGFVVLPINIQDDALLDPAKMGLDPQQAWQKISALIDEAKEKRAVLTVLWHTHSFSAPRFWEDIYEKTILRAKEDEALIMPAIQFIRRWQRDREAKT